MFLKQLEFSRNYRMPFLPNLFHIAAHLITCTFLDTFYAQKRLFTPINPASPRLSSNPLLFRPLLADASSVPITKGVPPGSTNFQCSHLKDHSAPFTYTVHYRVVINKLTFHCYPVGYRLVNKSRKQHLVTWWGMVLDLTASLGCCWKNIPKSRLAQLEKRK